MKFIPWENNGKLARFSQDAWVLQYEQTGLIMASASDIYSAPQKESKLIQKLKDTKQTVKIITSTRYILGPDLSVVTIQHYNSKQRISNSDLNEIPFCYFTGLELLCEEHGPPLAERLQTVFATQDETYLIIKTLKRLSGIDEEKICFILPGHDNKRRELAVGFYHTKDSRFIINCNLNPRTKPGISLIRAND